MKTLFKILPGLLFLITAAIVGYRWVTVKEANIYGFYLLISSLCGLGYLIVSTAFKTGVVSKPNKGNMLLLLSALIIALFCTEIGLRHFDNKLKSYTERNGKDFYKSAYYYSMVHCDSCDGRFVYVNQPNSDIVYQTAEFNYVHQYKSFGLRDREFNLEKDSNEYRILGLGDSFVEGVGTTGDSAWVKQLERLLNDKNSAIHYTTMNAGVRGSDLFFSYELLKRCLLKFKPDLVILNLNSTDIGEVIIRGDYERYDVQGNFRRKNGPWWEFAFASSYVVRLFTLNLFHYNWELRSREDQNTGDAASIHAIQKKIVDYYQLSKENNFTFLLVLQPLQDEIPDGQHFIKKLKIEPVINKIDLTGYLDSTFTARHEPKSKYYWPIDGHFTGLGYGLEADIIYRNWFLKEPYMMADSVNRK